MNSFEKALIFLRERATSSCVGDKLPGVRLLAEQAGVSLYAMSKALSAVCDEGLLDARPRRGITVKRTHAVSAEGAGGNRLLSRWQQVALVLSRRMRDSRCGADTNLILPKAVRVEFGVSPVTARRALQSLVQCDILIPHGRGYLPRSARGYGSLTMLLVTRMNDWHSGVRHTGGVRELLNQLEVRCSRDGVTLEYGFLPLRAETVDWSEAAIRLRELVRSRVRTMAVLSTAGISGDTAVPICEGLLAARAPLVLVDFTGAVDPARFYSHRLARVHVGTSTRDGEIMADFIANKGYSRVCFISPPDPKNWAEQRLEGIRGRLHERADGVGIMRIAPRVAKGTPLHIRNRDMKRQPGLPAHHRRMEAQTNYDRESVRYQMLLRDGLVDELRNVMRSDPPDLFVGANDQLAVACMDVLEAMGVDVLRDCAVVGFDNGSLATAAHLSSYDRNYQAIAGEILRFGYTCPGMLRKPVELAIDGFVVERLTTTMLD